MVRVLNLVVESLPDADVQWFTSRSGGEVLPANQIISRGFYYVSQKIGPCESARVRVWVDVVVNNTAPHIVAQRFCGRTTVAQLRANLPEGMISKWYNQATGGIALSPGTELQNGWYYASQSLHGCESPRTAVEVIINEIPQKPSGDAAQQFETGAVVNDIVTDQAGVVWFDSLADAIDNRNSLYGNLPLIDNAIYYGILFSDQGCWSEPFIVKVNLTLGINKVDEKQINYYPNPVADLLSIDHKDVISRVEVYTLTGQLVFVQNTTAYHVELDMRDLAKASYFIKIYTAGQSQIIKVFKK